MQRKGFSVIEVIVALGMAAFVIAAVGNLTGATHRLNTSSGKEVQAVAYAKQWIELVSIPATTKALFGCSCNTPGACTAGTPKICTVGTQTCQADARSGFSSCWVAAPANVAPFNFSFSAPTSSWTATDSSLIGFTRNLKIENLVRDISGSLTGGIYVCDSAHDCNTKKVTVSVSWLEGSLTRQKELSTILTAWKNF